MERINVPALLAWIIMPTVWVVQYFAVLPLLGFFGLLASPILLYVAHRTVGAARRNALTLGVVGGGAALNAAAERRHREQLAAFTGTAVAETPQRDPLGGLRRAARSLVYPWGLDQVRSLGPVWKG